MKRKRNGTLTSLGEDAEWPGCLQTREGKKREISRGNRWERNRDPALSAFWPRLSFLCEHFPSLRLDSSALCRYLCFLSFPPAIFPFFVRPLSVRSACRCSAKFGHRSLFSSLKFSLLPFLPVCLPILGGRNPVLPSPFLAYENLFSDFQFSSPNYNYEGRDLFLIFSFNFFLLKNFYSRVPWTIRLLCSGN